MIHLKLLNIEGFEFLYEARCCICGDMQCPHVDFDPDNIYAPVDIHEEIRMVLDFAAEENLIVERADIANAIPTEILTCLFTFCSQQTQLEFKSSLE